MSDFSALIEELNDKSIAFICIKEEFDTSKPMGKAMMYIASVFAQLERETIAERVRDNMLLLARTGRWLGGTTILAAHLNLISNALPLARIHRLAAIDMTNPQEDARLNTEEYQDKIVQGMVNSLLEWWMWMCTSAPLSLAISQRSIPVMVISEESLW